MIKRLRQKFIATNMLLVSLILLAVFSIQTFSSYQDAKERVYQAQEMALRWISQDFFLGFEFGKPHRNNEQRPDDNFPSVPFFAVELNKNGQVITLREGPGATVSLETAQALTDTALAYGDTYGRISGESLSYLFRQESGRQFCVFTDNRLISSTLRNQLLTSLFICSLALAGFYAISRLLARLSLRPAEQAWEQQRQFVADASHELKTPITVILANTDIVLAHPDDSVREQAKWIDYIQDEAVRMKGLVDDLLFLAKNDASALPSSPVSVRLDLLVTGCILPFESVVFEAGITLVDKVSPNIIIQGDEAQLRRLVVILLDNAVKYTGEKGTVSVQLEQTQDKVRLSVHNTGPSISPEHLPHLFERFYRSDAARDRTQGGYGLGLSIAKSITDRHRGTISVTSSSEDGTTFTVVFPKK